MFFYWTVVKLKTYYEITDHRGHNAFGMENRV